MTQLKQYSYYEDLYDKFTVEKCRDITLATLEYEKSKDKAGEMKVRTNIHELYVSSEVINRALNKKRCIEKWMKIDKEEDDFINSTKPPKMKCNFCLKQMLLDEKNFMSGAGLEKDRILFIFQCGDCNKKRAIYNDGEEFIPKKHLCPVCEIELNKKSNLKDDILTIDYNCDKCNYVKSETLDLEIKSNEKQEDINYEEDRKKFCISEEEAYKRKNEIQDFYQSLIDIFRGTDPASIAKIKEQEKYKPLEKIRRFTITELEEYLTPLLAEKGFVNFSLGKAEIDKEIHVYFTVINKSDKNEKYSSRTRLRKIINELISHTNWFFMNSGRLEERLGIIQGRLKGIDNNDLLLKLIEKGEL